MFNCSLFLNKAKSEFETILCYSFYKIKILTSEDQPNPIYFNSPLFLFKHHFLKLFSSLLLKKKIEEENKNLTCMLYVKINSIHLMESVVYLVGWHFLFKNLFLWFPLLSIYIVRNANNKAEIVFILFSYIFFCWHIAQVYDFNFHKFISIWRWRVSCLNTNQRKTVIKIRFRLKQKKLVFFFILISV